MNKYKSVILISVASIICIFLSLGKFIIKTINGYNDILVCNIQIPTITITGAISAMLILIPCIMNLQMRGCKKCIRQIWFLQILELILTTFSVSFQNMYESIPGIMLCIVGIVLNTIIYKCLSKNVETEKVLSKAASIDVLTGCLNRRGIIDKLKDYANQNKQFFLVFLDLDNFKQVNDTLGHSAGDELLLNVAKSWSNIKTDEKYCLARLGGDEFAMIVESTDRDKMSIFMQKVLDSISIGLNNFNTYITTSAGIAHYTGDTTSIERLLSYADTAMYKAKGSTKNSFCFFDNNMYDEFRERFFLEEQIKQALVFNSFKLMYQPQYRIKDHKLIGLEALIRLHDENGKLINTQDFINIAEKSGLIINIDNWVMENVIKETKYFIVSHKDVDISINISGRHLSDKNFIEKLLYVLKYNNFSPSNLKIEITESSYIKGMDEAIKNIKKLKRQGIKIALDDFGTGYSSLSYLSKIPVDLIKIDKSFVDKMHIDESKASFIDTIVKLGHIRNCEVIAEGVELQEQLDQLQEIGCDSVQGYIWGKPIPINDVVKL